jgi:conjugal transfer pilus assembly protein TraV
MAEGRQVVTALTAKQHAALERAVTRRSRGAISLPRVELTGAEAILLWQDLVLAYAAPQGLLLTRREQALLGKRAWARSAGHAALGEAPLSRQSGLAFWRLAIRLGDLAARRSPNPLVGAARITVIGLAATQLAACTSLFGGNIKGSFACSAPGGTCAPSTVIDDQALSVIQNARPMTPAGPYIRRPAAAKPVTASYMPSGTGRLTSAGGGIVHRERRVLKVVFPSFVDGGGNLHEPRIVHAVVDDGAWMELSSGEPNIGEQVEGRAVSLASAAFAPTLVVAAPIAQDSPPSLAMPSDASPAEPPRPEAVAAARAKGAALQSGNAIDAIRAEVQARLASTAKAPAAATAAPTAPTATAPVPAPAAASIPVPSTAKPTNGPAAFPAKVEE